MRDLKVEKWLERNGWTHEYCPSILVSAIIVDDIAQVQIRLDEPVDNQYVSRISDDLIRGAQLPAVVLAEELPSYAILDGIHRTFAYRAQNIAHADAYIVTNVTKDTYERIRRSINTSMSGKGLDQHHSIQQALALMKNQAMNAVEAGRLCNVNENTLNTYRRNEEILERIARTDPKASTRNLPREVISQLGRIGRSDLLKAAVNIAINHKITILQAKTDFAAAMECHSDSEAQKILSQWASTYKKDSVIVPTPSNAPDARIDRACRAIKSGITGFKNAVDVTTINPSQAEKICETLRFAINEYKSQLEIAEKALPSRTRRA